MKSDDSDDAVNRVFPAIAEAYKAHSASLHRVAYSVLYGSGLQDDAADVVNNAFLEILENPPTDVRNWEAYLVTVVRRRAIDQVKSAAARHRHGSEVDLTTYAEETDRIEEAGDGMDILGRMKKAVDALNHLEQPMQDVARDFFWRRRKQTEIAADLGTTQARVSQLVAAARSQMKDEIEGGAR